MSPNFRIALRFLTAKRRAMAMSLSCIILGVGLFVVTQATTSGFEDLFIKTILGTNGAIRVEDKIQRTMRSVAAGWNGSLFEVEQNDAQRYIEGIDDPKRLIETLKQFPSVTGTSEVLQGAVIVRSAFKSESVRVYGINLENHLRVSDLANQIVGGSLADYRNTPNSAILGLEMATRLQLEVGNSVELLAEGQTRRYRVAALYETGNSDIDKMRVYLPLSDARSLLKKREGASFLQVSISDKDRAPDEAEHMQAVLHYTVRSWQEREKTWLGVFRALRLSSAITVSVFTLIAGLAMFNTLAMIVMEKTKEIAILRSMGYTRDDISNIFLWQAGIVLVIGTFWGIILGAVVTYAVSRVPLDIHGIIKTTTFIVNWSVWHYVAAVLTAVTMVMVASLI
ncbi:MAG: FtsX-like permease family protein, partial [Opitutaceae bacterium]